MRRFLTVWLWTLKRWQQQLVPEFGSNVRVISQAPMVVYWWLDAKTGLTFSLDTAPGERGVVVGWVERFADGMVVSHWCPPAVGIPHVELSSMSIDEIKDNLAYETAQADCLGYYDGPAVRCSVDALVDRGVWCNGFADILFVETDAGGKRYWAASGRSETDQYPRNEHDFVPALRRSLREMGVIVSGETRTRRWVLANRRVHDIIRGRVDSIVGASILKSIWSEYAPDDPEGESVGLADLMGAYWDWDTIEDGLLYTRDELKYGAMLEELKSEVMEKATAWVREHPRPD